MTFDMIDKKSKVVSFNTDSVTIYNPKKEFINGNKAKKIYQACHCGKIDMM